MWFLAMQYAHCPSSRQGSLMAKSGNWSFFRPLSVARACPAEARKPMQLVRSSACKRSNNRSLSHNAVVVFNANRGTERGGSIAHSTPMKLAFLSAAGTRMLLERTCPVLNMLLHAGNNTNCEVSHHNTLMSSYRSLQVHMQSMGIIEGCRTFS